VPFPYAVMCLMLGCGQVGIFLITDDYRDHAVIKWNQFQDRNHMLVRTEIIRKLDFSDLSDLKIMTYANVQLFHNAKNFLHS
jgi:hypothetical protein